MKSKRKILSCVSGLLILGAAILLIFTFAIPYKISKSPKLVQVDASVLATLEKNKILKEALDAEEIYTYDDLTTGSALNFYTNAATVAFKLDNVNIRRAIIRIQEGGAESNIQSASTITIFVDLYNAEATQLPNGEYVSLFPDADPPRHGIFHLPSSPELEKIYILVYGGYSATDISVAENMSSFDGEIKLVLEGNDDSMGSKMLVNCNTTFTKTSDLPKFTIITGGWDDYIRCGGIGQSTIFSTGGSDTIIYDSSKDKVYTSSSGSGWQKDMLIDIKTLKASIK